jgi:hypothetical protein
MGVVIEICIKYPRGELEWTSLTYIYIYIYMYLYIYIYIYIYISHGHSRGATGRRMI